MATKKHSSKAEKSTKAKQGARHSDSVPNAERRQMQRKARQNAAKELSNIIMWMAVARDKAEQLERGDIGADMFTDYGYWLRLHICDSGTRLENALSTLGIRVPYFFAPDPKGASHG